MGQVDHHERQEQQPQGARAVAGGEVAPDVGLGHRCLAVLGGGPFLGVDVVDAAEHGGRVVAGDPDRARIVQHLLGSGAADPVDQEFQGVLCRCVFHRYALPPRAVRACDRPLPSCHVQAQDCRCGARSHLRGRIVLRTRDARGRESGARAVARMPGGRARMGRPSPPPPSVRAGRSRCGRRAAGGCGGAGRSRDEERIRRGRERESEPARGAAPHPDPRRGTPPRRRPGQRADAQARCLRHDGPPGPRRAGPPGCAGEGARRRGAGGRGEHARARLRGQVGPGADRQGGHRAGGGRTGRAGHRDRPLGRHDDLRAGASSAGRP